MKLLHTTDLHFRCDWFDWIAAQAPRFDAVCISGDLLDMVGPQRKDFRTQIKWVRDWIRRFPGKLFICSGNHDWWMPIHGVTDTDAKGGWLRKMSTITVAVDGSRRIENDIQFITLPWLGVPSDIDANRRVIVITHCPPAHSGVAQSGKQDLGDADLAKTCSTAELIVLCGHVHEPLQWFATVGHSVCINPGCDFTQPIPNHVIIDTGETTASLFRRGTMVESASLSTITLKS
jgi:uncharacterized protein